MQNELQEFSNSDFVNRWLSEIRWPDGIMICPKCNGINTDVCTHKSMPYRCADCRQFFSPKSGTQLQCSRIPLIKWTSAVIRDLENPTGILTSELSQEIGVSRGAARLMLDKIKNVIAINGKPNDFKYGNFFRFDELTHKGQLEKNFKTKKHFEMALTSAQFIVICITEFWTNKIWVGVIQKEKLQSIGDRIAKILPETSYIFTNHAHLYEGINHEKHKVRKLFEFEEFESLRASNMSLRPTAPIKSARIHLEKGFSEVYHDMSLEDAELYTTSFAGRWNIQNQNIIDRMKLVFTTLIHEKDEL